MTITLTNEVLRRACEKQLGIRPEDGKLHIFGIRGASRFAPPNTVQFHDNPPDLWNDTIGVFGTQLAAYPGTTDPGAIPAKRPTNPGGAAYLLPGRYRYKRGKHRGKWALVQASGVNVRRDRDRDGRPENNEPISYNVWIGLNCHRGGVGIHVADWGAGCQVVKGQYWDLFYAPIIDCDPPPYIGDVKFDYWLLDRRGFE